MSRALESQLDMIRSGTPNTPAQAAVVANRTFYPTDTDNLPYDSPHVQNGFVWGAPPVDEYDLQTSVTGNNFSPLGSASIGLAIVGNQITVGTFPQAQRIASILFAQNSGLLSVDTIVTIINATVNPMGVFVAKDVGPIISVAQSADIYDGIITYTTPVGSSVSKRSGASFSMDVAPLIKLNTSIAIYACGNGANLAASNIAVVAILRYVSLDG